MDATTEALRGTLDAQRRHVLGILEGLDEADLRRPVLPTGWSCLGLVQHLAVDIEQFWFRAVMVGELQIPGRDEWVGSAWEVDPGTGADAVFSLYRDEIAHANRVIETIPLQRPPSAWPEELFGSFRLPDLRAVILHVIAETACHAGHLDAARELVDGRTWMVL